VECLEAKTREKKTHHHQTTGSGLALPPLIKLEIHHCGNKGEIGSRKDTDIAAEAAPAAWAHLAKNNGGHQLTHPREGQNNRS